jgi:hypothetical protein
MNSWARLLAVESDHPDGRARVIAFVTERSSGSGAPGFSSWAIAEADRIGVAAC